MMYPKDWKSDSLENVLEKIIDYRGQSVPKSNNGIPLITARNVREGYLDFSSQEYVDEQAYEAWMSRGIPKGGDVLITTEAPLGMVAMYPNDSKRYAVGQRTVTLRPSTKIDAKYLMYYLLGPGNKEIQDRSSGSTAKGIKSSELKKISVLLPPTIEQKKIAEILSAWDEALAKLEKIENVLKLRHIFLRGQCFTSSESMADLKDVVEIIYGKSPKGLIDDDGLFPIIGTSGTVGKTNSPITSDDTVVIGRKGTLDNPIYVSGPCLPIDTTFWTKPKPDFHLRWIFHLMNHLDLTKYNEASGVPSLSRENLYRIKVPNHPDEFQKKTIQILDCSQSTIDKASSLRKVIQNQKLGLMQQLLTGKKRVKV